MCKNILFKVQVNPIFLPNQIRNTKHALQQVIRSNVCAQTSWAYAKKTQVSANTWAGYMHQKNNKSLEEELLPVICQLTI